jgi:hypothetical protein
MNSEESDIFDRLVLSGAIEVIGVVPNNGEFLYNITPKMKDIFPEMYNEHLNKLDQDIKSLWQQGFLDINIFEDNPMVYLTQKSFNEEEIVLLNDEEILTLLEIKRIFNEGKL